MTARSERERAEQAVIAAAVALWTKGPHWMEEEYPLPGELWGSMLSGHMMDLGDAVFRLHALGLRPIGDVTTNADAPQTSHAAAAWMKRYAGSVGVRVFREIVLAHHGGYGLTTEQVELRLKGKHQSISPRVTDLVRKGYIQDSGDRRETTSGHEAIVWAPTQLGATAAREAWSW